MDSKELYRESQMTYQELVDYLLVKYGAAKYDYFINESCKTKNRKASRTAEGLFCHHIDEDKAIMLSNDKYAVMNPFDYQRAERLVYCNFLEHLILHIKIMEAPNENANGNELPGIGGAINLICRQLNDFYSGYPITQQWIKTAFEAVEENYEDYIMLLSEIWKTVYYNPIYSAHFSFDDLCLGWDGQVIEQIYRHLKQQIKFILP